MSGNTSEKMAWQQEKDNRLLLHACCGPCAEFPVKELLGDHYQLTVYYHNPNIHPPVEWQRRLEQLQQVCAKNRLPLVVEGESRPDLWQFYQGENRCRMCYQVRLEAAAAKAAELGFPVFSTTLLVSPYQNHAALCEIGHELGRKYGVRFLDRDFRPGFREGQQMAREDGLYRQKYCGCLFSLEESDFRDKIKSDLDNLEKTAGR